MAAADVDDAGNLREGSGIPIRRSVAYTRRKKTSKERREQRSRAEARTVQRLLRSFQLIQSHRGNTLTKLGKALQVALGEGSTPPAPDNIPNTSTFTTTHGGGETAEEVVTVGSGTDPLSARAKLLRAKPKDRSRSRPRTVTTDRDQVAPPCPSRAEGVSAAATGPTPALTPSGPTASRLASSASLLCRGIEETQQKDKKARMHSPRTPQPDDSLQEGMVQGDTDTDMCSDEYMPSDFTPILRPVCLVSPPPWDGREYSWCRFCGAEPPTEQHDNSCPILIRRPWKARL